jgi:hypothetical protein
MKTFKLLDLALQSIIITYIIYIILFRFTINWDFILAFLGLGVLMIWQLISYFILLKSQGKYPQRIIYIVGIILLVLFVIIFYNNNTELQTKLLFILASVLASYYYIISIIEFIFSLQKTKYEKV